MAGDNAIMAINGICYGSNPCSHDVTYTTGDVRVSAPDICTQMLAVSDWRYITDSAAYDIVAVLKHLG